MTQITVLTRHDFEDGNYDSIKWAMETHVKFPDTGLFQYALLFGNEDAPSKITFYSQSDPVLGDMPIFVWRGIDNRIRTGLF